MAGFTPEQEAIVRNALAEFAAAVDACPALDLIRTRTAAAVSPTAADLTPRSLTPHERNES